MVGSIPECGSLEAAPLKLGILPPRQKASGELVVQGLGTSMRCTSSRRREGRAQNRAESNCQESC